MIEPFAILTRLQAGGMEPSVWLDTCRAADIAGVDLGVAARRAVSNRAQEKVAATLG